MKSIRVTYEILVDDEDLRSLRQYKWTVSPSGYASAFIDGKHILMHRLITNCPDDKIVDHINGNRLDNRRANLRICSRGQNMMNKRMNPRNKSGFRGVYRSCDRNRPDKGKWWVAQISIDGKNKNLGLFLSAEEAARAYDKASRKLYGEYGTLNFPDE